MIKDNNLFIVKKGRFLGLKSPAIVKQHLGYAEPVALNVPLAYGIRELAPNEFERDVRPPGAMALGGTDNEDLVARLLADESLNLSSLGTS